MKERYYKVEGNILFSEHHMLTWGPFYYHSYEQAVARMGIILKDITNWCNEEDPTMHIEPKDVMQMKDQIVFNIIAWKDEKNLHKCDGIINVEEISFED
jgi:hypothetical protein